MLRNGRKHGLPCSPAVSKDSYKQADYGQHCYYVKSCSTCSKLVHKAMRCVLSYAWIRLAFRCSRRPIGMACWAGDIGIVSKVFSPRDSSTFRSATRTTIGINRIRIATTLANLKAGRFKFFRVAHSYLPVVSGET